MRYSVSHETSYHYNNAVSVSHHLIRLTPRPLPYQRPLNHVITVLPRPAVLDTHSDYFGNSVNFVTIEGPHRELSVRSECEIELSPKRAVDAKNTPAWENVRELCRGNTHLDAGRSCEFVFASPLIPLRDEFFEYTAEVFAAGKPILEAAIDLMRRIHDEFEFDPKATTVATPLQQVFRQRRGVCQDFAHLQIACLRSHGLPARYVSGYIETVPPPGQPKLVGADASHAWLQLWCGESGWCDLDPTNNLLPQERHITLAWGRDFGDVSPLRGVLVGSGNHHLKVAVDVTPLPEPA
ncbi:MAG TPA: transglutaminase family protein [Verrucomicrobiae bacterium]|nr:transglutaminase family protein [Verrucomicrobiae bacterium]